jgi:hypothetical protein
MAAWTLTLAAQALIHPAWRRLVAAPFPSPEAAQVATSPRRPAQEEQQEEVEAEQRQPVAARQTLQPAEAPAHQPTMTARQS